MYLPQMRFGLDLRGYQPLLKFPRTFCRHIKQIVTSQIRGLPLFGLIQEGSNEFHCSVGWKNLMSSLLYDKSEVIDHFDVDQSPDVKPVVHLELQTIDPLEDIERQYERTQWLSTFTFSSFYLLCIGCVWGLLYFDPKLKLKEDAALYGASHRIMDGRVIGTMLKIFSVLGVWFVLLFLPIWLLLGTVPAFGAGALTQFFNPLDRIHYLIFFIIGLMTHCYIFHILSLLRRFWQSITLMLFSVNFSILSIPPQYMSSSSPYDSLCFMPFIGLPIMVKKTLGYPDPLSYMFIVLIAIGFLFGCRLFIKSEERFRLKKNDIWYGYQPH